MDKTALTGQTMHSRIIKPDPALEYFTDEQCFILEAWNNAEDPALSIARARVAPGVTTRRHYLQGVEERYVILSGQGRVSIGELDAVDVGPGDVIVIPAGTPQCICNTGHTDLLFYALCTPRFSTDCYKSL